MVKTSIVKLDQINFLIKSLSNLPLRSKLEVAFPNNRIIINGHPTNRFQFSFSEGELELILDELTLLLTSKGLKENDEPNSIGLFIEELIDLFNQPEH